MTTNKTGNVSQQPLYGCTSCYEYWTWPAYDLRVHEGECWCDLCWDERRWEFPDQPSWNDLEPYTPALQAEFEGLVEALDITELRELLLILRGTTGGALWTLDDEEKELAVRTEKSIAALAELERRR